MRRQFRSSLRNGRTRECPANHSVVDMLVRWRLEFLDLWEGRLRYKTIFLGIAAWTLTLNFVEAQIFYHKSNDTAAQAAMNLAKDAQLEAGLDTALKNVDLLEDRENDIEMTNLARAARSSVDALIDPEIDPKQPVLADQPRYWAAVVAAVCGLKTSKAAANSVCAGNENLDIDTGPTAAQLDSAKDQLNQQLKDLKSSADVAKQATSTTKEISDVIGEINAYYPKMVDGASKLIDPEVFNANQTTLQASADSLAALNTALKNLADVDAQRQKVLQQLNGLSDPFADLEANRLQAQLDHVNALLQIAEQQDADRSYVQGLVVTFECTLSGRTLRDESIVDSLRSAGSSSSVDPKAGTISYCDSEGPPPRSDSVAYARALEVYASAVVWGPGSSRITELRIAREQHRHSLRVSLVEASAADLVVGNGVQRLALYHQGGIKPEVLAQLALQAATLGVLAY